jgi:hypothetical protein
MRNHIKKPPPLNRGLGWGAGVECGKADAYLGFRHLGEHSNTGPHPTEHRKGKEN